MPSLPTLLAILFVHAGCSLTTSLPGSKSTSAPVAAPAAPAPAPAGPVTTRPHAPTSTRTDGKRDGTPEQWKAYQALVTKHQSVLQRLADLDSEHTFRAMPMDAAKAAAALEALRAPIQAFGELSAAACGEYHDLYLMDLDAWEEPRWVCDHAKRTAELIPTLARYAIKKLATAEAAKLTGALATLRDGYPVRDRDLEILATTNPADRRNQAIVSLEPLLPLAGEAVAVDALIPDIASEIGTALATAPAAGDKFKYKQRAPEAVAKVARGLFATTRYRGAKPDLKAVLARDHDWNVTRDKYTSNPIRRSHRTQVIAQVKGESFCRMYEVDVIEQYMGGGKWGKPGTPGTETGPRVISCKLD